MATNVTDRAKKLKTLIDAGLFSDLTAVVSAAVEEGVDPKVVAELRAEITALQGALAAARAKVDELERDLVRYESPFGLRTENGHFLCAEGGGGGEVNATRTGLGSWETFTPQRP